ncbi:MAG: hypothetical protein HKP62_06690 [Sulfurovum sp.]|nr:hypothetical protein [Sulfurovum sp.]NNJ45684.1 hypothetical protein [Sulfurovum sp.]
MKKIIILFIYLYSGLYALERESTLKMYHGIFSALTSKAMISIYTTDEEYIKVFTASKRIILAQKPEESDIMLITDRSTLNNILESDTIDQDTKRPILFVTDYHFLKYSEDVVGAFYWRKGRSQLLFIHKRLEEHNITLPVLYQKFMIDEL